MAENDDDAQEPEPRRALAIGGDAGGRYPFREFLRLDSRREALVYSQAGTGQTAPPPCECCPPCLWCQARLSLLGGVPDRDGDDLMEWELEHGHGWKGRTKGGRMKARAEVTPLESGHPVHALFADVPGRRSLAAECAGSFSRDLSDAPLPGLGYGELSWDGDEPEPAVDRFGVRCGELRADASCYVESALASVVVRYPCRVVLEVEMSSAPASAEDYRLPDSEYWSQEDTDYYAGILRESNSAMGFRIGCEIRANAWTKLNVFRSELTVGTDDEGNERTSEDERLEEGLEDTTALDVVLARSGEFEPNLGTAEQITDILRGGQKARWRLELLVTRAAEPDSGEGGA